jgi:peroxiredoxin
MTGGQPGNSVQAMITSAGTAAPALAADAFVRGEQRRALELSEFHGTWVVLAFAARRRDVVELARLEEAFAAGGAVVLAATPDDWYDVEDRYGSEQTVRFPILTGVDEHRRITAILDPRGVVRHVGLRRSARETLAMLEAHVRPVLRAA